jgi:tripartite-type tricarboxylate transporter receptor subunit TctC
MQRPLSAIAILSGIAFSALCGFSQAQPSAATDSRQAYPAKPVRLVSATSPGSQPDSIARLLIQKLSEQWGKPVIMDNRSGGGGLLASSVVAKAAPDGHTLLYVLPNFVISPALHPNNPHPPLKEFAAIGQIGFSTNILIASPSLGVNNVKDFIALAKAQPGKMIIGSTGAGTAGHLSGTRFNLLAGIKAVAVAYKGGPEVMIEVMSARCHYAVSTMGSALPFIKEGKLVPLGVTSPKRAVVLPDVPSLGEIQPGFQQSETSHGLLAPAGTPRAILHQISRDVTRALDLPDIKERLNGINFVIAPSTPEAYDKILRDQMSAISTLVVAAGLRGK